MKFRLWPRSLVGQLVFAVAVMLFLAQAINFVLLSRGLKQQTLAHGGGMAVARVIDAIERDRRGEFRGPPRNEEAREREDQGELGELRGLDGVAQPRQGEPAAGVVDRVREQHGEEHQ